MAIHCRAVKNSLRGTGSQMHGSADPDPDPPRNVMDPQHWFSNTSSNLFAGTQNITYVSCDDYPVPSIKDSSARLSCTVWLKNIVFCVHPFCKPL